MYRRPHELEKYRYTACAKHRVEAQNNAGRTEKQLYAFSLGRPKGTNHRNGYKHQDESKRKSSESHKLWCANNPDKVKARGEKTRGENHYHWKGGISKLNSAIRTLTENRKWMDAVKERDGKCTICGTIENLESHHIIPLEELVRRNGIINREQARVCAELWDLSNGQTLCRKHHYQIHGRQYEN